MLFFIQEDQLNLDNTPNTSKLVTLVYSIALFQRMFFVLSPSPHPQPLVADDCPTLSLVMKDISSC